MAEQKNPPKKTKVVIRRAPPALKVALILLILFSMAALLTMHLVHKGITEQTALLTEEAADAEAEGRDIQDKIDALGSVQSVQDIAQDELGLVDPDTVIIETE